MNQLYEIRPVKYVEKGLLNDSFETVIEYPSVWVFEHCHDWMVVGQDPVGGLRVVADFRKCDAAGLRKILFGGTMLGIKFMSRTVFMEQDDDFVCVKNRSGSSASARPPFRSLSEAAILSAANGWPEPAWLDDVLRELDGDSHA